MIRTTSTFGGFLNREEDRELGVQTLWIDLQRVKDFVLAIQVYDGFQSKDYG